MLPSHRILFDEETIARRVKALAEQVRRDAPREDLLVIGVLLGSQVFVTDLARELARQGLNPRLEMVWTSLYEADGRARETPRLVRDLPEGAGDPAGRPVLLVDDILDSGRTLAFLRDRIASRGPSWLRTCVLLDKPSGRKVPIRADYRVFDAPEGWIFGYGLDTDGEGRALPYLAEKAT